MTEAFDAHDLDIQNIRCLTQNIESRLQRQ